jgi:hypothetical protein
VGDELLGELKLTLAHVMSGEEVTKPLTGKDARGTLTVRSALMSCIPADKGGEEIGTSADELPRGHGRRLTIDADDVHENPLATAAIRIQRLTRKKTAENKVQRMRKCASRVEEGDEDEDEDEGGCPYVGGGN